MMLVLDRAISKLKNFLGAFRTLEAVLEALERTRRLEKHKERLDLEVLLIVEKYASRVNSLREEEAALLSNLDRLRQETIAAEKELEDIKMRTRSI